MQLGGQKHAAVGDRVMELLERGGQLDGQSIGRYRSSLDGDAACRSSPGICTDCRDSKQNQE
jgi:hypothetical protein